LGEVKVHTQVFNLSHDGPLSYLHMSSLDSRARWLIWACTWKMPSSLPLATIGENVYRICSFLQCTISRIHGEPILNRFLLKLLVRQEVAPHCLI
jgi:hypothetical protein